MKQSLNHNVRNQIANMSNLLAGHCRVAEQCPASNFIIQTQQKSEACMMSSV